MQQTDRSPVLPSDPFDITLSALIGLPNGAHTAQHTVQTIDPYGNSTTHIVQTVKTEQGEYVFIMQVNGTGTHRFILPPKVLALMDRQRTTTVTQVRRRHGKRLAAERGNPFTAEMRAKALATRRKKARS